MLLKTVTLAGFKSFRKRTELPLSDRTTVLIGPNDHGKTNALSAIERLNPESKFEVVEVNDQFGSKEDAYLSYTLSVSSLEIKALSDQMVNSESYKKAKQNDTNDPSALSIVDPNPTSAIPVDEWFARLHATPKIEVIRYCEKPLQVKLEELPEDWRPSLSDLVLKSLPKVILFKADTLRLLPDTVDLSGLQSNEVMQGVFRLASIWDQRENLLSGNTRKNQDVLRDASETLTTRIRQNWTQGNDLQFYLEYVGNNIRLTVKDTTKSVTAVGDRSEGFTSYFAMRMLLVARTESAQPHGYVFMFDEPGLNLHPKGQVDLQNVFENISETNQITYSTHSVFLINKNYPDRNHLVFKNQDGSNIDNKPFVGGWAKVKEHLGLYLSANFLFADKILLAEGATDEAYLPLILQRLIECGKFEGDLNAFAVHTSLNDSETVASANMYTKEERRVAVLVDGDEAGNKRKARIEKWSRQAGRKCQVVILSEFKPAPCSIEDFLEPAAFKEAVIVACKEAIEAGVLDQKENWEANVRAQLNTKENKTLGKRVEEVLVQIFGEAISDVWIARKYGELLRAERPDLKAALDTYWDDVVLQRLAAAIWKALDLPTRGDVKGIPLTTGERPSQQP